MDDCERTHNSSEGHSSLASTASSCSYQLYIRGENHFAPFNVMFVKRPGYRFGEATEFVPATHDECLDEEIPVLQTTTNLGESDEGLSKTRTVALKGRRFSLSQVQLSRQAVENMKEDSMDEEFVELLQGGRSNVLNCGRGEVKRVFAVVAGTSKTVIGNQSACAPYKSGGGFRKRLTKVRSQTGSSAPPFPENVGSLSGSLSDATNISTKVVHGLCMRCFLLKDDGEQLIISKAVPVHPPIEFEDNFAFFMTKHETLILCMKHRIGSIYVDVTEFASDPNVDKEGVLRQVERARLPWTGRWTNPFGCILPGGTGPEVKEEEELQNEILPPLLAQEIKSAAKGNPFGIVVVANAPEDLYEDSFDHLAKWRRLDKVDSGSQRDIPPNPEFDDAYRQLALEFLEALEDRSEPRFDAELLAKPRHLGRVYLTFAMFTACMRSPPSLAEISGLIEQDPGLLRKRNKDGCLPLHLAVLHNAPRKVLEYMLEEWPESAQCKNEDGNQALHLALAANKQRFKVIETLIKYFPESVRERNAHYDLPLHVALAAEQPKWRVIQLLVQVFPESVHERDGNGDLPLHLGEC